ncbi:MAG: hypothetical protein ACRBBN_11440 [Methyloligellaceae bacterium]
MLNPVKKYSVTQSLTVVCTVISIFSANTALAKTDRQTGTKKYEIQKILNNPYRDISPVPNYRGSYISLGATYWRKPAYRTFIGAASAGAVFKNAPPANCSTKSIVYYAERAPAKFQLEKKGLLYGVRTHTPATRVDNIPGYNSCALVVHAILKKAGCRWARRTANAKTIYDQAYRAGWRPTTTQRAGCIVAWNANSKGFRARIGKGIHRKKGQSRGVAYRHVGITTGAWMAMDNSSIFSRPSSFITTRPIRYEAPLFLCPAKKKKRKK